eukprot:Opistho-2@8108
MRASVEPRQAAQPYDINQRRHTHSSRDAAPPRGYYQLHTRHASRSHSNSPHASDPSVNAAAMPRPSPPATMGERQPAHATSTLKLGVVRLGKLCGKHKYMVIDATDIPFVRQFAFQARLELDRDGTGARIVAYAYHVMGQGCSTTSHTRSERPRSSAAALTSPNGEESGTGDADDAPVASMSSMLNEGPFHDLLWQYHFGKIPSGYTLRHRNSVSVDNRISNLDLVPLDQSYLLWSRRAVPQSQSGDASIYVAALNQLREQEREVVEGCHVGAGSAAFSVYPSLALDANGDAFFETGDAALFYECQNVSCTQMESEIREFHLCGRCRVARYCGPACQQMDWNRHRLECIPFRGYDGAMSPNAR